jgi:prevent-host-death family protein
MSEVEFTAQDLQKRTGEVTDAALHEPVAITYHGRRRLVMMSIIEYERLRKASEPRVYRLEDIPEYLLSELAQAHMSSEHDHLNALLDE